MHSVDLKFKVLTWQFMDEGSESIFYITSVSVDEDDTAKSIQLKVRGFKPFCYIELPTIKWTRGWM